MQRDKTNKKLVTAALLIVILVIIQIGDSYCSELFDKVQSLFLKDLVMQPLDMSLNEATVMVNAVSIPFYIIAAMAPLLRGLADYLGKKKVLLINLFLYLPGLVLCMTTKNYIIFLIGNSLISLSASVDIQYIYVVSCIEEKKRASVRGILAAAASLTASFVSVIRGITINGRPYDYTKMYGTGIILIVFAAVIVFIFLPWDNNAAIPERTKRSYNGCDKCSHNLIYLWVIIFIWGIGTSGVKFYNEPMVSMRYKTEDLINRIIFIQPIVTIIINIASGVMADYLSRRKAVCIDIAATAISVIIFNISDNFVITGIAYGIMIGAYFSATNIVMLMIMELSKENRIGRNYAWASIYNGAGNAAGMVLISILAKTAGIAAAKGIILIIPAVLTAVIIVISRQKVS